MELTLPTVEWFAAGTGICGALLLAANVRWSPLGFLLFLISSLCWTLIAFGSGQLALLTNQLIFVAVNLFGVHRWLIRPGRLRTSTSSD